MSLKAKKKKRFNNGSVLDFCVTSVGGYGIPYERDSIFDESLTVRIATWWQIEVMFGCNPRLFSQGTEQT